MFLMWQMMAIAMMLPTAAPMLRTYAEIADTAARKNQPAVPLVVLAAGYLAVWTGYSLLATLLQAAVISAGGAADPSSPVIGFVGGGILIIAGIYQFSALKNACLVKCRNPFTIIFAQWSNKPTDIFKLGLQQGMFCLGCCWALMLVMLSVGTMNLVWMAFLTLFTLLEKTSSGTMITKVFGIVLLAWGLFLVLTSANLTFS
jgi:predicted metal-binding membrane protein